jgi:hypothetical protein
MSSDRSRPDLPSLVEAYRRTKYRVEAPEGSIDITIGEAAPELDRLLDRLGVGCWAFITAYNPGSIRRSAELNERDTERLRRELEAEGFTTLPGAGIGEGWPPERSLLVAGMDREQARAAGRRFGQIAVVAGLRGAVAELVFC